MNALLCTVRYEALMAVRRKAVLGTVVPLTVLSLLLAVTSPVVTGHTDPTARVGAVVVLVNTFCVLGVGIALADRLRSGMETRGLADVLEATPTAALARSLGASLGPLLTALTPVAVPLLLYGAVVAAAAASIVPLAATLTALVTAVLPAALLAASLGGLLGALMPVAAARGVLVAAWLWAVQFPPALSPVPTPTGTVFSPLGGYPLVAWAHAPEVWARRESTGFARPEVTDTTALLNLALVVALALACYALGHLATRLRRHGAP